MHSAQCTAAESRSRAGRLASTGARLLAATLGAYTASVLFALALSRILPGDLGPATMAGMLCSYGVFAGCAMWAFACERVRTVWLGIGGLGLLGGLVSWLA